MQYYAAPLEKLIEQFQRLPGIGRKSAQRLAFHVLSLPEDGAEEFARAILDARGSIHTCRVCQNLTEGELCPICADPRRDRSTICVVTDPKDLIAIERTREYHGLYHVLHGVISPLNDVGPEQLKIKELLQRVAEGDVREVIMGLFFGKKKRKHTNPNVWVDPTSDEFMMRYVLDQDRKNRDMNRAQVHDNAPQDSWGDGWDK